MYNIGVAENFQTEKGLEMKKLHLFTDLGGIILGAGIYGLAVTGINVPSKLADGGVTGIALLLNILFGFAPSITSLVFNSYDCWNICVGFLFTFMGKSSYTVCRWELVH